MGKALWSYRTISNRIMYVELAPEGGKTKAS
jgi:hypothetical protein